MKTTYISPALRMLMVQHDIVTTSTPDSFHNQYREGEGLAPEKRTIWE